VPYADLSHLFFGELSMRAFIAITAALLSLGLDSTLEAGIVSQSSSVSLAPTPPANIRQGVTENNLAVLTFVERQSFPLSEALTVDISLPGMHPVAGDPHFTIDTIDAATLIDSYYLHFDPIGQPPNGNAVFISGFVTFDRDVLGIITKNGTLADANALIGLSSVKYPTGDFQGVELFDEGSYITLSDDLRTVSFGLPVGPHADNLRIVTAAVPEASSFILALVGAVTAIAIATARGALPRIQSPSHQ
jgi:hypothetical protein